MSQEGIAHRGELEERSRVTERDYKYGDAAAFERAAREATAGVSPERD